MRFVIKRFIKKGMQIKIVGNKNRKTGQDFWVWELLVD
jgi:hypothetical protein